MSYLFVNCIKENTDPYLAKMNSDGTLKCPVNWDIKENSEYNRYKEDPTFRVIIDYNESISIPFITNTYKTNIRPTFTFNSTFITSITGEESFRVYFNEDDYETITLELGEIEEHTIIIPENTEYIKFINDTSYRLGIFEDYSINFSSNTITSPVEFSNFNVEHNIKYSVTLANTIVSRKTGKTKVDYNIPLLLTSQQHNEIQDIMTLARSNQLLTYVYIDYKETAGNTISNYPQESYFEKYYFINYNSTQKSGLYVYVNLGIQNEPNSGIF